jgi:glycosyltransferase involved in cell wall biosynthesis
VPERKMMFPALLWRSIRILQAFRPDIVHTHRYKENLVGAIAGRAAGARGTVRTQHGAYWQTTPVELHRTKLYRLIDKCVARCGTDKVISVSRDIQNHFAAWLHPEMLETIPNGILLNGKADISARRKTRLKWNIPANASVLGTICRLVKEKGLEVLLHAGKIICANEANVYLMIVGDGPERERLQTMAHKLGISDRVRFTGFQGVPQNFYPAFDVFVLPSLHEGTPMSLLEAMNAGIPCVASDVGGVSEVLDGGTCGHLISSGNAEALALGCEKILRDQPYRDSLVANGRARAASIYDARNGAKRVYQLYRELTL